MITVDGRQVIVSETREGTLKTIIYAIEHNHLSADVIHSIQMACVFGAINHSTDKEENNG